MLTMACRKSPKQGSSDALDLGANADVVVTGPGDRVRLTHALTSTNRSPDGLSYQFHGRSGGCDGVVAPPYLAFFLPFGPWNQSIMPIDATFYELDGPTSQKRVIVDFAKRKLDGNSVKGTFETPEACMSPLTWVQGKFIPLVSGVEVPLSLGGLGSDERVVEAVATKGASGDEIESILIHSASTTFETNSVLTLRLLGARSRAEMAYMKTPQLAETAEKQPGFARFVDVDFNEGSTFRAELGLDGRSGVVARGVVTGKVVSNERGAALLAGAFPKTNVTARGRNTTFSLDVAQVSRVGGVSEYYFLASGAPAPAPTCERPSPPHLYFRYVHGPWDGSVVPLDADFVEPGHLESKGRVVFQAGLLAGELAHGTFSARGCASGSNRYTETPPPPKIPEPGTLTPLSLIVKSDGAPLTVVSAKALMEEEWDPASMKMRASKLQKITIVARRADGASEVSMDLVLRGARAPNEITYIKTPQPMEMQNRGRSTYGYVRFLDVALHPDSKFRAEIGFEDDALRATGVVSGTVERPPPRRDGR